MSIITEQTFLTLLAIPRGDVLSESSYINLMQRIIEEEIGAECSFDSFGNMRVKVGEDSSLAFTSHFDTVDSAAAASAPCLKKLEMFRGKCGQRFVGLASDSGHWCLGADCTTGNYIMLAMIEAKVEGLYFFYRQEEVGMVGSSWSRKNDLDLYQNVTHMISFDRMDTCSVISHQCGGRCASVTFVDDLIDRLQKVTGLDFYADNGGVYTDSYQFMGIIPECTNLSVGYYNQHTSREVQNLDFLQTLVNALCTRGLLTGLKTGGKRISDLYDAIAQAGLEDDEQFLNDLDYLIARHLPQEYHIEEHIVWEDDDF